MVRPGLIAIDFRVTNLNLIRQQRFKKHLNGRHLNVWGMSLRERRAKASKKCEPRCEPFLWWGMDVGLDDL